MQGTVKLWGVEREVGCGASGWVSAVMWNVVTARLVSNPKKATVVVTQRNGAQLLRRLSVPAQRAVAPLADRNQVNGGERGKSCGCAFESSLCRLGIWPPCGLFS
jgi:hypothetical protein